MSCTLDAITEVINKYKDFSPEQLELLYSEISNMGTLSNRISNKDITKYLEKAWPNKLHTAFTKLCDHGIFSLKILDKIYKIIDNILYKEGVKVVARLFYKLNQKQRRKLYDTLDYKESIQTLLNESVNPPVNTYEVILSLSDHDQIDLEAIYNYLINPPSSPIKISPSRKRSRNNSTNSSGPSRKRRRHPSPSRYSPPREISMSKFGRERSGNEPTKEEEASARKLFFPDEKTQTTITSFFKKPSIIKSGTIKRGPVTNNNSNNED